MPDLKVAGTGRRPSVTNSRAIEFLTQTCEPGIVKYCTRTQEVMSTDDIIIGLYIACGHSDGGRCITSSRPQVLRRRAAAAIAGSRTTIITGFALARTGELYWAGDPAAWFRRTIFGSRRHWG